MKIIHDKEIVKQLKQINTLMELRIEQLKSLYPYYWWETSLKDEMYSFLCRKYAQIKCMEINPKIEVSEDEKKNLLAGLTQLIDIKNHEKTKSPVTKALDGS